MRNTNPVAISIQAVSPLSINPTSAVAAAGLGGSSPTARSQGSAHNAKKAKQQSTFFKANPSVSGPLGAHIKRRRDGFVKWRNLKSKDNANHPQTNAVAAKPWQYQCYIIRCKKITYH